MSNEPQQHGRNFNSDVSPLDEGGLRPPPELGFWRRVWWWFDFLILVKLARLRFIAILVVIGAVITQWDTLVAYYERWTRPADSVHVGESGVEWFCPMHPSVVRDNDKEKCPICFMPLSKRKKGEGHAEELPAGVVSRVQLSPYRVVLAGARTSKVDYVQLTKEIRTVGYVEFNERGLKTVSARVKGRIDRLLVNETGQTVKAGEALTELYSPELLVTVQNLLDAQKRNDRSMLASARNRLELLGIEDDQIDAILTTGKTDAHIRIRSPLGGHVIKKYVREGQYVDEGTPLYDVADLSSVWIQAQVYEDDLPFLPTEQLHEAISAERELAVVATTRAYPNEEFHGKLTFIYPHVDQESRTVAARFELPNPGHKLRPGTTATISVHIPPDRVLAALHQYIESGQPEADEKLKAGEVPAIPEGAVIDTGRQKIVYRATLPGTYEGIEVVLGPRMTGPGGVLYYPVLQGLQPGDEVVSAGSFLIDAETRLNPSAGSIYFGGTGSKTAPSAVTAVRPSTPEDPDAKIQAALAKLSPEDRRLAEEQRFCPILKDSRLGSMGTPIKLTLKGEPVFLCCPGCRSSAEKNPDATVARVKELRERWRSSVPPRSNPAEPVAASNALNNVAAEKEIQIALAKLSPTERDLARAQRFCAVLQDSRLGSMGPPVKVSVNGETVYLCCEGCRDQALAKPELTVATVKQLKQSTAKERQP